MAEITVGIIDPFHHAIIATIEAALPEGWALSVANGPEPAARAAALRDADMAFVMGAPLNAELLEQAGKLRFVQKLGAGVDRIDVDGCAARGIAVARLQAGNAIPVAEHTVMLMLAACRRLPWLDRSTRAGQWDKEQVRGENRHLFGKTVGIVGFGAIGRRVAELLRGFGVDLAYYDPIRAGAEVEAAHDIRYAALDDLIATADVVTLHLPLLKETVGLLNADRLAAMKPGSILVNAARGGLVEEAALQRLLVSGHIFAAGLDAYSAEPPVGNPLLTLDNTVVTPHCAGATIDNFASIAARAVSNATAFLAGDALPPDDVVVPPRS